MYYSEDPYLSHYGVKGMKWGVRHDRPEGVSRRTSREAQKDAKEFTRAKMFYGDGAGTRRKLIKATVNAKSKDPNYKKAFDYYVDNTDMAKRAEQARSERKRKNVASSTKKTARGIVNVATGNASRAGATVAGAAAAYGLAYQMGMVPAPKVVATKAYQAGKGAYEHYKGSRQAKKDFYNIIKDAGLT